MTNIDLDKGGRFPQIVRTYLGPTVGYKETDSPVDIEFIIEGGGQVPLTGYKGSLIIPDWLTIANWVILSDVSGSCVVDVWRITLTEYLAGTVPTVADSITDGNLPTLTNAVASQGTNLNGWTTLLNQNDVVAFNLNSVANCTNINVTLQCIRNIGQS